MNAPAIAAAITAFLWAFVTGICWTMPFEKRRKKQAGTVLLLLCTYAAAWFIASRQ
jgi:hypothetical protein